MGLGRSIPGGSESERLYNLLKLLLDNDSIVWL